MGFKNSIRNINDHTPFKPTHMGYFICKFYFKKYLRKLPVQQFEKVLDAHCSDVLEHIKGNITAIRILSHALKPGDFIFFHIPYDRDEKRIFPDCFFKEFNDWAAEEHIGEQYSTKELSEILKNLGFTIKSSAYTFGFPGTLAWEIDRICDHRFKLKILLMPFLKLLAWVEVKTPHRKGSTLVLAQKTEDRRQKTDGRWQMTDDR